MGRDYDFFVYMVTNFSGTVLYTGVTNDLPRRLWEHQHGEDSSQFTKAYHADRLVFFEHYGDVHDAIAREKQIKGWTRAKKEALIRTMNPQREDISCQMDPNWRRTVEGPSRSLHSPQDDRGERQVVHQRDATVEGPSHSLHSPQDDRALDGANRPATAKGSATVEGLPSAVSKTRLSRSLHSPQDDRDQ